MDRPEIFQCLLSKFALFAATEGWYRSFVHTVCRFRANIWVGHLVLFLSVALTSTVSQAINCFEIFEKSNFLADVDKSIREVMKIIEFPAESDIPIANTKLRLAIYEAFGERDFYTGEPIDYKDMRIDHVIPSSKGGPDNIYNYVPTTNYHNGRKSNKIDVNAALATLALVRTVYANKVIGLLAFEENKAPKSRQKKTKKKVITENKGISSWVFWEWEKPSQQDLKVWNFVYENLSKSPDTNEIIVSHEKLEKMLGNDWSTMLKSFFIKASVEMKSYHPDDRQKWAGQTRFFTSYSSSTSKNEKTKPPEVKPADSGASRYFLQPKEENSVTLKVSKDLIHLVKNYDKHIFLEILSMGVMLDPNYL